MRILRAGRTTFISFQLLLGSAFLSAAALQGQDTAFHLDPGKTTVTFTLGAALHSVHGRFAVKQGDLRLDPATGKLSGEIVVDARSGDTSNAMRDRRMHRDILESEKYPEISFRPDRVEGTVASPGKSPVRVHGRFAIHGAEHELDVPAEVEMLTDRWTATAHFTVPYEKWGIKNPSTLFLRVSDSVEIEVTTAGKIEQP